MLGIRYFGVPYSMLKTSHIDPKYSKNTYYFAIHVYYLIVILCVISVSSRGPQNVEILISSRLRKQMVDSSSIMIFRFLCNFSDSKLIVVAFKGWTHRMTQLPRECWRQLLQLLEVGEAQPDRVVHIQLLQRLSPFVLGEPATAANTD